MQMAESQKTATPSVKSKEKSSLLDIDIGKDFLGSWKSMADDGMDFDFGPTTGGKKKAFKFDKMDMDFSLDAEFDKLSSFKMDMPGLDISSPTKKSGKSKESNKEASSSGENQAKRDSFAFSFDFDKEFGDLDFGSSKTKTKIDEKSNKCEEKEGYLNSSGSGCSGDLLANDVDASKDDISAKHIASRCVSISKVDTQMDNIKDLDPRNDEDHLKPVIDESCLLKPENVEEQETQSTTSPEKIISCNLEEPIQESHTPEKQSSLEPVNQQVLQDLYAHSVADNVSTEGTFSDAQEEESRTVAKEASSSTGAELVPTKNLSFEKLSAHMNSRSQKNDMCKERDDNVLLGHIDGDDTSKGDSHLENSLTPDTENLGHGEIVDKRNADSIYKRHMDSLDSGTTIGELVSEKERGNIPNRSKYFQKQNGSESELQQASISSTKLISVGSKRMSTLPNNSALQKREFGSKFTGVSRSLPKVVSRDIPVSTENTETGHLQGLNNIRECLNADNIKPKNEPMVIAAAHDISPTKKDPVSKGSDLNTEHINEHRSDVHSSSSIEQSNKNISQISQNHGVQVTSMTSTRNMREIAMENNRISPTKSEMRTSEVSTLRVSRATELKLKPLNSMLPKGLTSMKNKEKDQELQRNMLFKRNSSSPSLKRKTFEESAEISRLNPTPSLKRKTFEESGEIPRLTPSKRLSASPSLNIRASSKEVCNHANVTVEKSPRLDVSQIEIDVSSTIENDGNFEKAEACSKELEDICNMLKKKHEEAKDILVRAIVNNNNLLMLNHPIHQDKIHMVQKFAELLLS